MMQVFQTVILLLLRLLQVKHRSPVLMVGEEVEAAMLLVEILSCWLEN